MSQSISRQSSKSAAAASTRKLPVETAGRGFMKVTLFADSSNFADRLLELHAKVEKAAPDKQAALAKALGIDCGEGYAVKGYTPEATEEQRRSMSLRFLRTSADIVALYQAMTEVKFAESRGSNGKYESAVVGSYTDAKGKGWNVIILAQTLVAAQRGDKFLVTARQEQIAAREAQAEPEYDSVPDFDAVAVAAVVATKAEKPARAKRASKKAVVASGVDQF